MLETETLYWSGSLYISKTHSESPLKISERLIWIINFYMQGLSYNFLLTSLSLSIIPFFVILSFLSDRMKIISKVRFYLARAFSPRRCMYLLNLLYLTVISQRKSVGKLKPHRDGAYICFGPFSATDSLLKEWIYLSPDCSFYWSWTWKWKSLSHVRLFATSCQASLSMELSRQEYWSR